MKYLVALLYLVSVVAADSHSHHDGCMCHGFVLAGDQQNDVFSITYPHTAGCGDDGKAACKEQCKLKFGLATNNGDLDARPASLGGSSVGELICRKVPNINNGVLAAFAHVCDDDIVDTGLRGEKVICCSNGVQVTC